jgi:cytoskeletal protein CcmA (bactofilin family)
MNNPIPDTRGPTWAPPASRPVEGEGRGVARPAGAAARPEAKPSTPSGTVIDEPVQGSVLGATLRFRGELRADEDFVLQGHVEGSIHHSKNLTIGTDGIVKGDSRAATLIVDGTVEGDLYALESIHIRTTARVQGNLFAPRVAIADGAQFNGKIDMASAARAARQIVGRQAQVAADDALAEELLTGTDRAGSRFAV